jgi:hypothetical protein
MMAEDSTIRAVEMAGWGIPRTACVSGAFPEWVVYFEWELMRWDRYNHYVELVEPSDKRACIRCCDDPADCPLNKGESSFLVLCGMLLLRGCW